jgi:hypothetical protein
MSHIIAYKDADANNKNLSTRTKIQGYSNLPCTDKSEFEVKWGAVCATVWANLLMENRASIMPNKYTLVKGKEQTDQITWWIFK